jgi:hypothetical protein
LDAARDGRVAPGILEDGHPELRRITALLLADPGGDAIGRQLFEQLRRGPRRWPGFEAVHALPRYDSNAQQLVQRALLMEDDTCGSAELTSLSASILTAALPQLARQRRGEPWVPDALMALGELAVRGAEPVLESALRRRLWLFAEWPAKCRQAARLALQKRDAATTRTR